MKSCAPPQDGGGAREVMRMGWLVHTVGRHQVENPRPKPPGGGRVDGENQGPAKCGDTSGAPELVGDSPPPPQDISLMGRAAGKNATFQRELCRWTEAEASGKNVAGRQGRCRRPSENTRKSRCSLFVSHRGRFPPVSGSKLPRMTFLSLVSNPCTPQRRRQRRPFPRAPWGRSNERPHGRLRTPSGFFTLGGRRRRAARSPSRQEKESKSDDHTDFGFQRVNQHSDLGDPYFSRGPVGAVDDETAKSHGRSRADANHGRRPGGGFNNKTAPTGGT